MIQSLREGLFELRRENSDRARFCQNCAHPLEEAAAPRETRKVVTVLFSDVTGSTTLGEQLDPESLRNVMSRFFDAMQGAVERHGGLVEKFIGDAVMAVFGIPRHTRTIRSGPCGLPPRCNKPSQRSMSSSKPNAVSPWPFGDVCDDAPK